MLLNAAAPHPEVLLLLVRRGWGGDAQEPRRPTARGRGSGGGRGAAADLGDEAQVSRPQINIK